MEDKMVIEKRGRRYFFRLSETERKHHNLMFLLMFLLFATGFPLRFHGEWWAPRLYAVVGGPALAPTIHRFAGLALSGIFILHILTVVNGFASRPRKAGLLRDILDMEMVPNKRDLREFVHHMLYLLYLRKSLPEYGRMTWREKIDYLALYRGIPVIAVTGILLWQTDLATLFIPGIILNIAQIIHSYEVTLILLSVAGFHWYNVHYSPDKFPMSHAFITGYLNEDEMRSDHFGEYRELMGEEAAGAEPRPLTERIGSRLYSLFLILLMSWYALIACRYIYYAPGVTVPPASSDIRRDSGTPKGAKSSCLPCHTHPPHADSRRWMEPYLNMHSAFIYCETCHTGSRGAEFAWMDPETGNITETVPDYIKRVGHGPMIASGGWENGRFIPFISVGETERMDKKNHRRLRRIASGCGECHSKGEEGFLPLSMLGYSRDEVSKINRTDILDMIKTLERSAASEGER